jgi:sporulation protein YlmC with PRC-barrel domain
MVMMMDPRFKGKELIGKLVVSEETGRKFGAVGDVSFITETGELMNIVLVDPTRHVSDLQIEEDERGRYLIPFSSVKSIGDFVIISERDII